MRFKVLESIKKHNIVFHLLLIYFIGVLIYFSIENYSKCLGFIPDERYYIQAAKALANGDGICYNGLNSTFQKIFYSFIISPAYLVKNLHIQIRLVCLLGILFEMTSIFPIYLISRKLELNRTKSLLLCIFSLSSPTFLFSMTFMSETAFMPLWLWVVYIIMIMLEKDDHIVVSAIIVGVLGYFLYMCKEVGIVAIPAFCLTKFIIIIRKKESIKGMLPCLLSGLIFVIVFFVGRIILFGGSSGSYSYAISVPQAPESSDKTPVSFFLYALIFYLGYMILVNNIFPLFIRSNNNDINHKLSIFIEIAILTLLVVVVYKISLKEDYGLMSPRLHFRYFEPLFIPYILCFISRLEKMDNENIFAHKYIKVAFGIFLAVLMVLPGLNSDGLLDATTLMIYLLPEKLAYHFFLGSPQKTVIFTLIMKVIILLIVLLELKLLKKNKNKFIMMFLSLAFLVNISSAYLKYNDIRKVYELPENYVIEMQEVNDQLSELPGRKLIIARQFMRVSEIAVTYYDINETDIYLAGEDFETTNKTITLKACGSIRDVDIADYNYVVYDNSIWDKFEGENISPEKIVLSTEHFIIVEN